MLYVNIVWAGGFIGVGVSDSGGDFVICKFKSRVWSDLFYFAVYCSVAFVCGVRDDMGELMV